MEWTTRRGFVIVYALLLFLVPAFIYMFAFAGTLSVAAWVIRFGPGSLGINIYGAQIAAWATLEGVAALALAALISRLDARVRRVVLAVGLVCAIVAGASPIYCFHEGVWRAAGGCTNAVAAFWLSR